MKDKVIYCNNAILNKPGFNSTAAASVKISSGNGLHYEDDDKEPMPSVSGSLNISDCNRVIELDLYANTKEEYDNNLHKLKTLLEIVNSSYFGLLDNQHEFNEQYDRVDARIKQEQLDKKSK